MEEVVDGKERGCWNWDHNHCLGNKKMYPRHGQLIYGVFTRPSAKGIQLVTLSLGKYAKQMKQRGKQWAKRKI
jgi:hypothetical protein